MLGRASRRTAAVRRRSAGLPASPRTLDVYFDVASPFAYFGLTQLAALAERCGHRAAPAPDPTRCAVPRPRSERRAAVRDAAGEAALRAARDRALGALVGRAVRVSKEVSPAHDHRATPVLARRTGYDAARDRLGPRDVGRAARSRGSRRDPPQRARRHRPATANGSNTSSSWRSRPSSPIAGDCRGKGRGSIRRTVMDRRRPHAVMGPGSSGARDAERSAAGHPCTDDVVADGAPTCRSAGPLIAGDVTTSSSWLCHDDCGGARLLFASPRLCHAFLRALILLRPLRRRFCLYLGRVLNRPGLGTNPWRVYTVPRDFRAARGDL